MQPRSKSAASRGSPRLGFGTGESESTAMCTSARLDSHSMPGSSDAGGSDSCSSGSRAGGTLVQALDRDAHRLATLQRHQSATIRTIPVRQD